MNVTYLRFLNLSIMSEIWKFQLKFSACRCEVYMPAFTEILSAQLQNDLPVIWGIVGPDLVNEKRIFLGLMTGQEMPFIGPGLEKKFLATLQKSDGIVIHIFEVTYKQK